MTCSLATVHPTTLPALHRHFLDNAIVSLMQEARVAGIAVAGSYAENVMDDFSDLDLIIACRLRDHSALMQGRRALAHRLGPLVAAFSGEHVGEPRLLICLYGPPALHVDLKVVALPDLAQRVDQPVVLWDRDGETVMALQVGTVRYPEPDAQWIEDRFWVWIHYASMKVARGELQEGFDFLSFLRVTVLGPLGSVRFGLKPAGVRRVEAVPMLAERLAGTVGSLQSAALYAALLHACDTYIEFRPAHVNPNLQAERVAMDCLTELSLGC